MKANNEQEQIAITGDEVLILPPATHKGKSGVCTRSTDTYCHFIPFGQDNLKKNEKKAVHKYVRITKPVGHRQEQGQKKAAKPDQTESKKGLSNPSYEFWNLSASKLQALELALAITMDDRITEEDLEEIAGGFAQMIIFHGRRILALRSDEDSMGSG